MTPDQLVSKWAHVLHDAREIPTWTEPASLAYCAEVASKSEIGVELGTYMGASAYVMLAANPKLHLWCVDTFAVFGTLQVSKMFLKPFEGRVEFISGDSAHAALMLKHITGRLDCVWVDDGHATEDVMRDISSFMPILRSGGTMFGHDFDVPYNDVAQGVIRSLPHNSWTFPVPRVWSYKKP